MFLSPIAIDKDYPYLTTYYCRIGSKDGSKF